MCYTNKMPSATLSEERDLLTNTIYLTFNQPEKNEYVSFFRLLLVIQRNSPTDSDTIQHRGIFITSANPEDKTQPSGTLFHAVFANSIWGLERRLVSSIGKSKSLVLMWRVAAVNALFSMDQIENILQQVPCRADHNTDNEEEGRADFILSENAEKGGFSCVPWTENALRALRDEGIINVSKDIGKSALHSFEERNDCYWC